MNDKFINVFIVNNLLFSTRSSISSIFVVLDAVVIVYSSLMPTTLQGLDWHQLFTFLLE